ncbi:hypothetical protein ACHWQZ_G009700 [Mnemiopsis leidyi]
MVTLPVINPVYFLRKGTSTRPKEVERLYSFLSTNGVLTDQQFGFRKKHSTTHAHKTLLLRSWMLDMACLRGQFLDLFSSYYMLTIL